jgi:hypothetical protein
MFTDSLNKVVCVEMLTFALALIKCCWVVRSIAGLPNIREILLQNTDKKIAHFCLTA